MHKPSALLMRRVAKTAAEIRQLRERLHWTQARLAVVPGVRPPFHREQMGAWSTATQRRACTPPECARGHNSPSPTCAFADRPRGGEVASRAAQTCAVKRWVPVRSSARRLHAQGTL